MHRMVHPMSSRRTPPSIRGMPSSNILQMSRQQMLHTPVVYFMLYPMIFSFFILLGLTQDFKR